MFKTQVLIYYSIKFEIMYSYLLYQANFITQLFINKLKNHVSEISTNIGFFVLILMRFHQFKHNLHLLLGISIIKIEFVNKILLISIHLMIIKYIFWKI